MWWLLLELLIRTVGPIIIDWIISWIDNQMNQPGNPLTHEHFVKLTGKHVSKKDFERVSNYYRGNLKHKAAIHAKVKAKL